MDEVFGSLVPAMTRSPSIYRFKGPPKLRPYLSKKVRHNIRLLLILFTLRGPSRVSTMGGARYYVIFVDDFSRFTWIYLLHSRSDFLQVYRDFYTMIRTQFSKNIQIFRSNSGGE